MFTQHASNSRAYMLPTSWLHSYLMLPKACRLPERLLAGLPAPLQQQLSQAGGAAPQQQQPQRVAFSREAMLTTHAFRGRAPTHAAAAAPPVDIKAFLESRPSTQQPRAHTPPKLPTEQLPTSTQNSAARNIASSSEEAGTAALCLSEEAAPDALSLSPAERSRRSSQQRPPAGTARGARDMAAAAVHLQQDGTLRGALSLREDKLSLREDGLSLREDKRRSAARAGRSRSRSRQLQECTAVKKRTNASSSAVPRAGLSRSRPQSTVSHTAVPRTGRSSSRPHSRQPRGARGPQERRSLGALCLPTINVLVRHVTKRYTARSNMYDREIYLFVCLPIDGTSSLGIKVSIYFTHDHAQYVNLVYRPMTCLVLALLQTNEYLHMEARYVAGRLGRALVPLPCYNVCSVPFACRDRACPESNTYKKNRQSCWG